MGETATEKSALSEWMTPGQVCHALNISRATLHLWDANGTLCAGFKLPSGHRRYARADVEALIRGEQ